MTHLCWILHTVWTKLRNNTSVSFLEIITNICKLQDCLDCNCDPGGARDNVCDKGSGNCKCKTSMNGRRCDQVIPGSYSPALDYYSYQVSNKTCGQISIYVCIYLMFMMYHQHLIEKLRSDQSLWWINLASYNLKWSLSPQIELNIRKLQKLIQF